MEEYSVSVNIMCASLSQEVSKQKTKGMEQYTTATTTTGEQIVVQTANGQIQQQVSSV